MKNKSQSDSQRFQRAFLSAFTHIARGLFYAEIPENTVNENLLRNLEKRAKACVYMLISYLFALLRDVKDLPRFKGFPGISAEEIREILALPGSEDSFFSQIPLFQLLLKEFEIDDKNLFDAFQDLLFFEGKRFNYSTLNVNLLGKTYESLLSQKLAFVDNELSLVLENTDRKNVGAFYTPDEIVKYILEETLGTLISEVQTPDEILSLKILDPAAGCGQFILGALDFVRKKFTQTLDAQDLNEFLRKFAENCLFAVDLDSVALDLTKLALWLETGCTHDKHLVCANSLNTPGNLENSELFKNSKFISWHSEFSEVFQTQNPGFDIVLGNPPYISFSGRQAVKLDEKMKKHLRKNFAVQGWLTTHSLFTELAVKHLTRRFVSFVVPSQVSHLAGYAGLRALIEKNAHVINLKNWGENVFTEACTPAMTFICEKKGNNHLASAQTLISWSTDNDSFLIEKIRKDCFFLGKLVADPGVHTGNCAEKIIKSSPANNTNYVPVLEGKQIRRYKCLKPVKFLNLGYKKQPGEYFSIRSRGKYENAEFIIRQTADAPVIAPRLHAVYFRNSALALYSPANEYNVKYLVGVLNSSLMRFFYREIIAEAHQKAFPQVKVRSLRFLPIKNIDFTESASRKYHDEICACVEKIMQTTSEAEFTVLDRSIDKLVFELYSMTQAEIAVIEERN